MEQKYIINYSENGEVKSIKILEGVTRIEKNDLPFQGTLEEIEFPESLKEIRAGAFYGYRSLKRIKFPKNIKYIGDSAFQNCTSLEEMELPENCQKIGKSAFDHCTSLRRIKFSKNIKYIGDSAFQNCTSLEEIEFPENLKKIEKFAFNHCTSLKRIKFSENIECIERWAFTDCISLEKIEFPESLKEIGDSAFYGCTSLRRIKFSKNIESIKNRAFEYCSSLEEIEFPDSLKEIEEKVFHSCTSLKCVKFSKNIKYIGDNAFQTCTSLEKIEIPENCQKIGKSAFDHCTSLKSIKFSENIECIERWAFTECISLEKIEFPESLKEIENFGFSCCTSLKHIKFSNPTCHMNDYSTFSKCTSIETLEFSENFNNNKFLTETKEEWQFIFFIRAWNLDDKLETWTKLHTIILHYNNAEDLIQNIQKTSCEFHDDPHWFKEMFSENISIHLVGPQLSILQKIKIKKWLQMLHITNIKFVNKNTYQDTMKNTMISTTYEEYEFDDEIKKLLVRIDRVAQELPNSSKDYVSKLKQNLITHYQEEKEREIPKLDWNTNRTLTLEKTSIGNARMNFIIQLNNMILMLSHQEKLLDLLFELKKYDNIFEIIPTNLVNNPTTIEKYLQNIIFLSSKIDLKKQEEVLNRAKYYLESPKQEYEKKLKESFENHLILSFRSEVDPKTNLLLQLSNLFDSTLAYYEQVSPYITFKNSLQSSNQLIESYLMDDSLESMLKNLRYLIHAIAEEAKKEELNTLLDNLIEKYFKKIESSIQSEDLSNNNFINITSNFHKELNQLLIWLNEIAIKEKNTLEFKKQLQYAIENEEENKTEEKHKYSVIDLFIMDINQIIEENSFSIEEKENIAVKIEEILKKYIAITNDISSKTEIDIITKELYSEFAGIELTVQSYAHDRKKYADIYHFGKKNRTRNMNDS